MLLDILKWHFIEYHEQNFCSTVSVCVREREESETERERDVKADQDCKSETLIFVKISTLNFCQLIMPNGTSSVFFFFFWSFYITGLLLFLQHCQRFSCDIYKSLAALVIKFKFIHKSHVLLTKFKIISIVRKNNTV